MCIKAQFTLITSRFSRRPNKIYHSLNSTPLAYDQASQSSVFYEIQSTRRVMAQITQTFGCVQVPKVKSTKISSFFIPSEFSKTCIPIAAMFDLLASGPDSRNVFRSSASIPTDSVRALELSTNGIKLE